MVSRTGEKTISSTATVSAATATVATTAVALATAAEIEEERPDWLQRKEWPTLNDSRSVFWVWDMPRVWQ